MAWLTDGIAVALVAAIGLSAVAGCAVRLDGGRLDVEGPRQLWFKSSEAEVVCPPLPGPASLRRGRVP